MTNHYQNAIDHLMNAHNENNETIDELNEVIAQCEQKDVSITELTRRVASLSSLLDQQMEVVDAAIVAKQTHTVETKTLRAQLKELQLMDPKRLVKVNKEQKKTIADIKVRLVASEKSRKETLKSNKAIAQTAVNEGNAAFHFDPVTKNAIRALPNLFVGEGNNAGGIPGTPVLEFMHHASGISRQGLLSEKGTIAWASAKNSTPTSKDSLLAKDYILEFCKVRNIKLPKIEG
jgi:hypothetical protein